MGVEELVVIVMVEGAEKPELTVTELGLNDADAPKGKPEAERLMVLEVTPLPSVSETVTVAEVLLLCSTEPLDGETETVNV